MTCHWTIYLCFFTYVKTNSQHQFCPLENVHKKLFVRLVLTEQSIPWQGFNSLGCPLMLRTNYRCVQSLNISVDDAKCVENVHKFTKYTHFLFPDWTIYSWQGFNSSRMSSYAKNKLQMCSVTQHQCRRRQMCGKCSQIHIFTHILSVTKNDLSWLNNLFMARFQLIRCHHLC